MSRSDFGLTVLHANLFQLALWRTGYASQISESQNVRGRKLVPDVRVDAGFPQELHG